MSKEGAKMFGSFGSGDSGIEFTFSAAEGKSSLEFRLVGNSGFSKGKMVASD